MADKEIMAAIRQREADRASGMEQVNGMYGPLLAEVVGWLVDELRAVADLYLDAKLRGGKATADDLRVAARVLQPLVEQLGKTTGQAPPPSRGGPKLPAEWCGKTDEHGPHPWELPMPPGGDPLDRGPLRRECTGHRARDLSGLNALVAERSSVPQLRAATLDELREQTARLDAEGALGILDSSDWNELIVERLQHAGALSSGAEAFLRGSTNDIPGTVPLGPGSVHDQTGPLGLTRAVSLFDDPAPVGDVYDHPVTHAALGMGQHGAAVPVGWSSATTDDAGFRVPGVIPVGPALFDDPAPRREALGTRLAWADLRGLLGKDRRGAGLPAHLSHSQMDTIEECGLKYVMQRDEQLGVIEVPQWALIGGNAFHAAVEWFERVVAEVGLLQHVKDRLQVFHDEHGGREQTHAEALWGWAFGQAITEKAIESPVPQDQWRASKQGMEGYTWWLVNGGDMVQKYLDARLIEIGGQGWRKIMMHTNPIGFDGPDGSYSPMIEWEYVTDVEGVPFKGVIDQVWQVTDRRAGIEPGDLLIDDCKSGAKVGPDTRQLGEYALWLRGQLPSVAQGAVRIWGRYYDARKGTWTEPVDLLATHSRIELETRVAGADLKKQHGMFTPNRSNFCGGCPVKHACPIFSTAP